MTAEYCGVPGLGPGRKPDEYEDDRTPEEMEDVRERLAGFRKDLQQRITNRKGEAYASFQKPRLD
jgi:hypothetical protein